MKGTKNPINLIKTVKYRKKHQKEQFPYYGIDCYMGNFGSGKTLSVVSRTYDILQKYPECTFISNTIIKKELKNPTYIFSSADELLEILQEVLTEKNQKGYVILMDEMHVVLSDLFASANTVFLTYLSQLRKFGIYIIGSSQIYSKCPKMIRDYLRLAGQIIYCKKIIPGMTLIKYVNMETCRETSNLSLEYDVKLTEWFFHTIEMYELYETKAVISQIKSLMKKKEGVNNEL